MAAGFIFLLCLVLILLAVIVRFAAGGMDRQRIQEFITQRGGTVESMEWQPFGRGWFGEKGERIYTVRYRDAQGLPQTVTAKTSAFSGVYFTGETLPPAMVSAPPPPDPRAAPRPPELTEMELLRQENARLRREIAVKDEELARRRGFKPR